MLLLTTLSAVYQHVLKGFQGEKGTERLLIRHDFVSPPCSHAPLFIYNIDFCVCAHQSGNTSPSLLSLTVSPPPSDCM